MNAVVASAETTKAIITGSSTDDAVQKLGRLLSDAGWEIEFIELDLANTIPTAEIRIHRADGLWIRAFVDRLGRATISRFKRDRRLMMDPKQTGRRPLSTMVDDEFLGRTTYPGARSMMRVMCTYLTDNALDPVELTDMRQAWAGLMQAPMKFERPPSLIN